MQKKMGEKYKREKRGTVPLKRLETVDVLRLQLQYRRHKTSLTFASLTYLKRTSQQYPELQEIST